MGKRYIVYNVIKYSKQIHSVGERFILKIHQDTTLTYSDIVDVSVSDRDRKVNNVRIVLRLCLGEFLIHNKIQFRKQHATDMHIAKYTG